MSVDVLQNPKHVTVSIISVVQYISMKLSGADARQSGSAVQHVTIQHTSFQSHTCHDMSIYLDTDCREAIHSNATLIRHEKPYEGFSERLLSTRLRNRP